MCRSTTDTLTTQCHNINQFGLYRETHYYTPAYMRNYTKNPFV